LPASTVPLDAPQRCARRQRAAELRLEEKRRQLAHPPLRLRLDLAGHRGEAAVAIAQRERAVGVVVAVHVAALVAVLPARGLGHDIAVGVDVVERHLEILAHGLEQRGAVEQPGDVDERAVHDRRIDRRALLRVLPVGIEVDALGEPLVGACDVAFVGKQRVHPRKRRADDPAMVRRVHATGHERLAAALDELAQLHRHRRDRRHRARAQQRARGARALEDEREIGRRVKIGLVVINRAVRVLRREHVADGGAHRLDQLGGAEITRARRTRGGGERRHEAVRPRDRVDAARIGHAADPAVAGALLLLREQRGDPRVVALDREAQQVGRR
jgi:hypothetical protein